MLSLNLQNTEILNNPPEIHMGGIFLHNNKHYVVNEITDDKIVLSLHETELENLQRRIKNIENKLEDVILSELKPKKQQGFSYGE